MTRRAEIALLVGLMGACGTAVASPACPPLSAYRVTNVSAENVRIGTAMEMLVSGTTWSSNVAGSDDHVTVSFRGVSGPLDQVLSKVVEAAGQASVSPVSMVTDTTRCIATVTVMAPPSAAAAPAEADDGAVAMPAPAPAPAAPQYSAETLRAGSTLSEALTDYAGRKGWTLRWQLEDDYILDVDVPIPPMSLIDGVTYVVRAYQAQGGLNGVVPRFARSNKVVVIEKMNVRERAL